MEERKRKSFPRAPRPEIVITRDLIEQSKRKDSSHGMIAEGLRKAVPRARFVSVDLQTVRFTHPTRPLRFTYLTPARAQVALVKFDQGDEDMEPFSFKLGSGQVTQVRSRPGRKRAGEPKRRKLDKLPKRARLVPNEDHVPRVVGGEEPPTLAHRREFGLRALQR